MQADAADGQQHLRPVGKLSLEAPAPTPSPERGGGRPASRTGGSPCPWGGSPHPERQERPGRHPSHSQVSPRRWGHARSHQQLWPSAPNRHENKIYSSTCAKSHQQIPSSLQKREFLCFLGKTMPPPTTRAARSQRPASRRRPALHRRSPGLREARGTQARQHGGRCQQALPRARQRAGAKTETVSGDGGTAMSPPSPATSWTAGS